MKKDYQIIETEKEIQNILNSGALKVTLQEFQNIFLKYGLKVCLNTKNLLHKYYNTSNPQHYLCATTHFVDETKKSFANIESNWYKEHVTKGNRETQKYKDFQEDRNKYFTVLKSGHILTI